MREHAPSPDGPAGSPADVRAIVREEILRALRAVAAVVAAGLLLYLGVVFLALMSVYILGALIEPWVGAAIVGTVILVLSVASMRWALRRFRQIMGAS